MANDSQSDATDESNTTIPNVFALASATRPNPFKEQRQRRVREFQNAIRALTARALRPPHTGGDSR